MSRIADIHIGGSPVVKVDIHGNVFIKQADDEPMKLVGKVKLTSLKQVRLIDENSENEKAFQEKCNSLFHRLWSKSIGQKRYKKDEWNELAELLKEKGIHV